MNTDDSRNDLDGGSEDSVESCHPCGDCESLKEKMAALTKRVHFLKTTKEDFKKRAQFLEKIGWKLFLL